MMDAKEKQIVGKKILFLAPAFFGYELKIKFKMEDMGAIVDFYDVRSVKSPIERALLKISPNIFLIKTYKYYDEIIKKNHEKNYDYIFIVKCEMITGKILKRMRVTFQSAKFCLYLWDSVDNIPGVEKKFQYFDRVFSFDKSDSEKFNKIFFRPLFYLDEFRNKDIFRKSYVNRIDLIFLGTIHSDRYSIINKIEKFCKENDINF
jgi:hypothetical protein